MSKQAPPKRGQAPEAETVETTSVLVVGAGPVGLTLAMELEHHGVEALLVERNLSTTRHPKMDVTNGRSMELYRRLGVADELRKIAIPADHPTSVTWATSAVGWKLASFDYPCVDEMRETIRECNDGTLPLEPWMRVSQVVLEPALREVLEARAKHVRVQYGWTLESFEQDTEGVTAHLMSDDGSRRRTVRAQYLAGCDGAGSRTRRQLGISLDETDLRRMLIKELGLPRTAAMLARSFRATGERPMDGRIYLVHFTTPEPEIFRRFGNVWHLQSPEGWTVISQNDGDTFTLHAPLGMGIDADRIDPREFVYERIGRRFEMNVLVANAWTPRLTVADAYGSGRVWLAGDAVHQVPPTGGYGMNTGVGDAIGLGWALAAVLQGWGTPGLLRAYEHERRGVALRNRTAAARHSVIRGAVKAAYRTDVHSERWVGARARRQLGREIRDLGNLENEALGIELGYRYDTSPVMWHETASRPPRQTMDEYTPSTWPGARPPSVLLQDGRALFDLFHHHGFTLLRFADHDVTALTAAAAERGVPLEVVDVRDVHTRALYERDLVLIRPDQHVAWRGDTAPLEPVRVMDRIRGAHN
ncbi:FAD-dependent monooxygenase [Streptomyces mayonensis]|uniref:FAD-dependent monooxygenase n=1 Tax=Streptomyces mayonensis TaxID=2750816 RepID=UPI001C1E6A59|nr:FAD-dependent monooxygenase [Streptomyces sp. A108]MBU6529657.1 FAD-dependent monooxygenase [Streptomyces sp. A108]